MPKIARIRFAASRLANTPVQAKSRTIYRLVAGSWNGTNSYNYMRRCLRHPLAPGPRNGLIAAHPDIAAGANAHTEELMKKTLIAGLTALALIGTQAAFAQQPAPEGAMPEHHRFSAADMKAFTDAKVAALKAGLELTADQEKNWAPVEQAIRAMAEARQARWAERREHAKTEDGIAKLRARADAMTQRGGGPQKARRRRGAALSHALRRPEAPPALSGADDDAPWRASPSRRLAAGLIAQLPE